MKAIVDEIGARAEIIRRFNRMYTKRIGVLDEGLLQTPFSLTAARVLYELASRGRSTAAELSRDLDLDAGYVSRMVRGLEQRGLLERAASGVDGRQQVLTLTAAGLQTFDELDARSHHEARALVASLPPGDQRRLVGAMEAIEQLLGGRTSSTTPYLLRSHRPGDIGWIIHRHGVLYAQEYGWDERFEALVAEIAAKFIRDFDSARERCWIAERDGENVGCVMLVRETGEIAKLRLLLVEPSARGSGLGRRLVAECLRFARQCGYKQITLWTNDVLDAARRIYLEAGFRLIAEEPHHSFGHALVGQHWILDLASSGAPSPRHRSQAH